MTAVVEGASGAPVASLTDTAYESLRSRLVLLDIPPGAPINEQGLSKELGIGRTPLREALKRLESDHLVVTYPRRGTFASSVDITALSEISEIRQSLEPLAAGLASGRLDMVDRNALQQLQTSLRALPVDTSARDHMDWDLHVHRALYRACHNEHLQTALTRYGNLATRIWSVAAPRLADIGAHVIGLVDLIDAVLAGDEARAEQLMLEHMRDFESRIRTVL
ncbi:GntR family transcriptional regulator [Dermatophilaceae bacterium Sec6.4]|nr:GntR family transcriptional regulator [Actinomycetota bacterium]